MRDLPPGPAHMSSQRSASLLSWPGSRPWPRLVRRVTGAWDRAIAASWLPSSWTAAAPDSVSGAGSPDLSVKAYGDQRPGSASGGMTSSRGGPDGNVAMVTLGRALPAASAAASSVTGAPPAGSAAPGAVGGAVPSSAAGGSASLADAAVVPAAWLPTVDGAVFSPVAGGSGSGGAVGTNVGGAGASAASPRAAR